MKIKNKWIRITGKKDIYQEYVLGEEVDLSEISLKAQVVQIKDCDEQDGTYDRIYVLKIV